MPYTLPTQPGPEFFVQLRERFTFSQSHDKEDRDAAQEDVRFAMGGLGQWDDKVVRARRRQKRPILTENRLGPSIAQVVNDGRQNKPGIITMPLDGGNEETAEHFQGRIRQIEYQCDADIAYDTARRQQVISGRGFYRVTTRYVKGNSGPQELAIEPIPNQFSVVWDAGAKKYDLSDAAYFFVLDKITKEEHERRFGKQTQASKNGFFLAGDNPAPGWMGVGGSMVQIADYYCLEEQEDGTSKVCIYVTNGVEILDETEWIGSSIPIIPQFGEQTVVDERLHNVSLIRNSKEPQKLVNLYVSNIAEEISRLPKNPYLAAEGQIVGRESEWESINEVARAVVQYKTRSASGDPVGPPIRNPMEPPIAALVSGYLQAVDAVKATMGIFDAALGANHDDTSGVAIARRQHESDITNFHFSDNESRSRKRLGILLLELIPIIDGIEAAEVPVRDEAGKTTLAKINQHYAHPKTGQPTIHDMAAAAKYQVGITSGPSYTTQRQEENERQGEFIKAAPELMWVLGDLYFNTSDGPGSKQMAERMERAISLRTPGLIDQKSDDPAKQMQMLAQQAQQLHAMNDQLTAHVHQLSEVIETKQAEQQAKLEIAKMQEETKRMNAQLERATRLALAEINTKSQDQARMSADMLAMSEAEAARAHDVGLAAMDQHHQLEQAEQARGHASDAAQEQSGLDSQAAQEQAGIDSQAAQQQAAQQGAAEQQQMQPGKIVSIRGQKHVVHKVHPDQSFDAVPIPEEEPGEEAA